MPVLLLSVVFLKPWYNAFLESIKDMCPQLVPIFYCAYGNPTSLRATTTEGKNQIVGRSETGTRQGDPLSMLFFAMATHSTMLDIDGIIKEEMQAILPNQDRSSSSAALRVPDEEQRIRLYADDININAPDEVIRRCLPQISTIMSEKLNGMSISWKKCALVGKNTSEDAKIDLIQDLDWV